MFRSYGIATGPFQFSYQTGLLFPLESDFFRHVICNGDKMQQLMNVWNGELFSDNLISSVSESSFCFNFFKPHFFCYIY